MPWTCPKCKKQFKSKNQVHSCARVPIVDHLKNKPAEIQAIYDRLMKDVSGFGKVTLNPVKSSIQVKAGANFLIVSLKKSRVDIQFFLDREVEKPPITRSFRISRKRVLHSAVIENEKQVTKELIGWLRESYKLVCDTLERT